MGFLIIDGNSILNRAFYGIRVLTNSRGVATNAVTGFMNTLLMLEKDVNPDMIAVAFDLKAPTFRHKMYDGYKANRKGMPEDLAQQLPYMKKIITAMGITIIEKEGFEADDIIGTVSAACADKKIPCTVSTGDRDSFQLVNDYVTVRLAKTKGDIYYTPDVIMEEYGVTPKQMIEVKALMGDSSDNIPGVPGIGEKTALSLIKEFASVDGVYENIGSTLITKGVRTKLENGKESCYMSRQLAEICLTAPIDTELSHYVPKERDDNELARLLSELEMYKMLQKLKLHPTSAPAGSKEALEESAAKQIPAMPAGDIVLTQEGNVYAGAVGAPVKLSDVELKAYADSDSTKYTFDIKETLTVTGCERLKNNRFDTTLAAYLADPDSNDYSLSRLCAQYGVPEGNSIQEKSITVAALNDILNCKISETGSAAVLTDIEIPLATVLVAMEREGVSIDADGIKAFGKQVCEKAEKISREIYEYAGYEFNIGSPKQLGSVLFEKLALPSAKKTKTGYSTNADVLESLMDKHPIVPLITEYRALTKLQNTYVTGLLKVVGEDGSGYSIGKNTIRACVHNDQTLMDGQTVKLRLLEPLQAGNVIVPKNSLVSGSAKVQGERLDILVSSLEYAGNIIPVELAVYDSDGQKGLSVPSSLEQEAAKEAMANIGAGLGTSISFAQSAGQQVAMDITRGLMQGGSQYLAKKFRTVKVHLKANYQVMLYAKQQ